MSGKIIVDHGRAEEVLGVLYESYLHNLRLFKHIQRETHAPQQIFVPSGIEQGSVQHRCWLFFAAMTDRREQSERVYESHVELHKRHQELYVSEVVDMNPTELEVLLKKYRVGSPGQSAKYWPRCAETLFGLFGGDPLNLYQDGDWSIDDILAFKRSCKIDPLPGFGPKILSLLSLFYEELGLMQMPEDAFPVDVHVQRFAISVGIISAKGKVTNEETEWVLRRLLCGIISKYRWSALELSHAIWFLGNRLCSGCYRNKLVQQLCPVYDRCGGSISTLQYFRKGVWDFDADRHRKGSSRDFCLSLSAPLFSIRS